MSDCDNSGGGMCDVVQWEGCHSVQYWEETNRRRVRRERETGDKRDRKKEK